MRSRRQAGFTLLEVVVAFVVLALTLTTVFQIFSTGLARAGDLDERSQALAVAQSRLAGAGVEEAVKEGETRGESADRRFRWVLKTVRHEEALAEGAAAPQSTFSLYRVEATVAWSGADGRERDLRLSTLLLGPRF